MSHQRVYEGSSSETQQPMAMHYQNRNSSCPVNAARDDVYHPQQDRSYQVTHPASPCATPWFSDEELSPRASEYYSDLFALYSQRQNTNVAPSSYCHVAASSYAADTRKASTATTFPGPVVQVTEARKTDYVQPPPGQDKTTPAPSHSFLRKHYQKARAIYQNGPPGEAELFWESIKCYREAKQGAVFEMCAPSRTKTAPQQPRIDSAVSYRDISHTSCEVPIKLHQTVLAVDTNRPLPSVPPLYNVPLNRAHKGKGKVLDLNKPLPRTPFPYSDTLEADDDSPVDAPWPTHTRTVGSPSRTNHPQATITKPLPTLPKGTGKSKPSKEEQTRAALKAKISRPVLITPSAILPQITDTDTLGKNAKGEQKLPSSPTWRDMFAAPTMHALALHKRKRPDSDESFACQGVREGEGLKPLPLFTGSSDDVREQWVEHRRTGWWI